MRLLFAHDHRFQRGPAQEVYTTGCLPAPAWDRYLQNFEELRVIARDDGMAPEDVRLARADAARVTFEFFPNLSSPRQLMLGSRTVDERMRSAVQEADAIVARLPSEIGLLAIKHARALGKPYAVEVVGCAWDGFLSIGPLTGRLYAPFAYLRNRNAIARAPMVLYVTSSWLQRRYPSSGHSASASNVALPSLDKEQRARRELRLAKLMAGDRPVLGTIGSLQVKYKGIQTAFKALARLRSAGLDLTYRIVGAGLIDPWQQLAHRLGVADLVHFDGTRSAGEDVFNWLDEIDIYLQPSLTEGLPRAMIEAMSRGAACLGSTRGGIPELLPPSRLHPPADATALAELIRRLATDPNAVAEASRADRETARQFDAEILEERRRDFFARLRALGDHPRGDGRTGGLASRMTFSALRTLAWRR
jgi:glycosyltransferase involved in cell wall biosynthesis